MKNGKNSFANRSMISWRQLKKFDKGEIDRKAYKGISGGFGSHAQRDPSKHMLRLRMAGGNLTEKRLEFLYRGGKGLRCGAHEAYDM